MWKSFSTLFCLMWIPWIFLFFSSVQSFFFLFSFFFPDLWFVIPALVTVSPPVPSADWAAVNCFTLGALTDWPMTVLTFLAIHQWCQISELLFQLAAPEDSITPSIDGCSIYGGEKVNYLLSCETNVSQCVRPFQIINSIPWSKPCSFRLFSMQETTDFASVLY